MTKYHIGIEFQDGEVKKIMDELDAAQEVIYNCYCRLQALGVVVVKKAETASGN